MLLYGSHLATKDTPSRAINRLYVTRAPGVRGSEELAQTPRKAVVETLIAPAKRARAYSVAPQGQKCRYFERRANVWQNSHRLPLASETARLFFHVRRVYGTASL